MLADTLPFFHFYSAGLNNSPKLKKCVHEQSHLSFLVYPRSATSDVSRSETSNGENCVAKSFKIRVRPLQIGVVTPYEGLDCNVMGD
ncbi:hypothetical protein BDP27DRAFT_1331664 [Rhodocollybia butyracea]|uniref:Uncharacterized protein n=1 Tax=Rhodocollybia butyracea TaxID=206335 RepID=A0A9P5PHY4_9AGAR|nr:hypothetical protein BDP27DRAFT_1331664 [Rhodocollybia butyracea]